MSAQAFKKYTITALAFSFPIGVLVLAAPDSWFATFRQTKEEIKHDIAEQLQKTISHESNTIKQLDIDLLRAKGEVLKLEEMKNQRLVYLQTIQNQLAGLIEEIKNNQFAAGSTTAPTDQRKSR